MIRAKDPEVAQALTELLEAHWREPHRTHQGEKMMRVTMARILDRASPKLITEVGYWRDPVQVFAGVSWFLLGATSGFVLALLLA